MVLLCQKMKLIVASRAGCVDWNTVFFGFSAFDIYVVSCEEWQDRGEIKGKGRKEDVYEKSNYNAVSYTHLTLPTN